MKSVFQEFVPEKFENEFAKFFGNKFGVFFPYGRVAIYSFLRAMGIKNTFVVIPAYTCGVVAASVVLSGNHLAFVDVTLDDFNMDLNILPHVMSDKVQAVIATHMFGNYFDMGFLKDVIHWAEKQYKTKIWIIQDLAHIFGGFINKNNPIKWGDVNIFGLSFSKNINSIYGGMLTTNNETIYTKVKDFRDKILRKTTFKTYWKSFILFIAGNLWDYPLSHGILRKFTKHHDYSRHEINGKFPNDWNISPPRINEKVGLAQLLRYLDIVKTKQSNCLKWRKLLNGNGFIFPKHKERNVYSHCVGLIQSGDRDAWIRKFQNNGIEVVPVYEYALPYLKPFSPYKKGEYPKAKFISERNLSFPIHRKVNVYKMKSFVRRLI